MVDLKCKRVGCEFNKNCNCGAKKVLVDEKTNCTTYTKDLTKENEKDVDSIPMPLVRSDVKTYCKAKCVFNRQGECVANGITVCTENRFPECSTFMPK